MQLLVFTLKPMTAEKRALGLQGEEYEKARILSTGTEPRRLPDS